eukprot:SAG31_NODE_873_length_11325_cov_34.061197_10_plen_268_part_00
MLLTISGVSARMFTAADLLADLPAFERCLDAGSYSVMCSYSSLNGVPGCADARALQTVLREQWKLRGFVVSDCGAVQGSPAGAVASIEAGCDLECNPWGQGVYPTLINSTRAGNVSAAAIATAAARLLYVRLRLGDWNPPGTVPFADKSKYGKDVDMSFYEQVSLEAAQQSIVLLKNDGLLPLNTTSATVKHVREYCFAVGDGHQLDVETNALEPSCRLHSKSCAAVWLLVSLSSSCSSVRACVCPCVDCRRWDHELYVCWIRLRHR